MQVSDDHTDERTYAAQATEQDSLVESVSTAQTQRVLDNNQLPSDRSQLIYSYVTLVAERCHEARIMQVNEVNNVTPEAA